MNAEWFAPRPMTSNRCRGRKFWGQNKTAPGRGGGPGACLSEALGGIRARRGDGAGFKRTWSSPLLKSEDGDGSAHPKCESCMHSRQKRICRECMHDSHFG